MSSINFQPHDTIIPSSWLNSLNYFYYSVFNGCVDAASARTAIGALSSSDVSSVYETQAHAAATYAPIAAPALTGNATSVNTPALHDASTKIANTQFVFNEVQAAILSPIPVLTKVFAYNNTAAWAWPTGSAGPLPLTTKLYDTLSEYNAATGVFTASNTGYYNFTLRAAATGATSYVVTLVMTGTSPFNYRLISETTGYCFASCLVFMNAGETATVSAIANAGAISGGVSTGVVQSYLSISRSL